MNTREKILLEALRLFSRRGYDAVSVEQIAQAVGIRAPSLYTHYRSKQDIFDAILAETAQRYAAFADGISVHTDCISFVTASAVSAGQPIAEKTPSTTPAANTRTAVTYFKRLFSTCLLNTRFIPFIFVLREF